MATTSMKEYLKKYENNDNVDKKKKKKKSKTKTKPAASGVLVVDEDPVWQKPVNLEEEEEDELDGGPQVEEDIYVKQIKDLELLSKRSYNQISAWVPISDNPTSVNESPDLSPPRNRKARFDTPSPEPGRNPSDSVIGDSDLSPPRQDRRRNDSPSPMPRVQRGSPDLSPPRQRRRVKDSPSPQLDSNVADLSPPRKRGRRYDSPSPEPNTNSDLSPPRRGGQSHNSPSPVTTRKSLVSSAKDMSPPRRARDSSSEQLSAEVDLSPPRKSDVKKKTGLISGKDVREEIAKIKKSELSRFNKMDASESGQGAAPVYRYKGERVSKDDYLKLTKKQEKPKEEKKLEWSKGLAQKRDAEAKLQELELEKEKPFARSRDDPELDRMMKDRLRWGDPMAHLVKRKSSDLILPDFGDTEKMKESGFIVPQDIPRHSWLKRGLDFEPNRYGIKPGRHWDGVNRSNGYEKQLFKRTNEKKATEQEAYLWSVSDM